MKSIALWVLSIVLVVIGALGLIVGGFFAGNTVLNIIEIVLGAAGVVIALVGKK